MKGAQPLKSPLKKGCNVTNHSIIYWPVNLHFPYNTFFLMEGPPTLWTKAVLAGVELLHLEESLLFSRP